MAITWGDYGSNGWRIGIDVTVTDNGSTCTVSVQPVFMLKSGWGTSWQGSQFTCYSTANGQSSATENGNKSGVWIEEVGAYGVGYYTEVEQRLGQFNNSQVVKEVTIAKTSGAQTIACGVWSNVGGSSAMAAQKSVSASAAIPSLGYTAPNPPTLASIGNVADNDATVTFAWVHNPTDGTAQTAAEAAYSTDGGSTWTTLSVSGASGSKTIANPFTGGQHVVWRARTKGTASDWSAWSANQPFTVIAHPTATLTQPSGTKTAMPIPFFINYQDASGAFRKGRLTITAGGVVAYEREITALSFDLGVSDWIPANGQTYSAAVTCESTTGLTCQATGNFSTSFTLPKESTATATDDGTDVTVRVDVTGASGVTVSYISINRNGIEIASGLADGDTYTDRNCPQNVAVTYTTISHSASEAVRAKDTEHTMRSLRSRFIFAGGQAFGKWNPSEYIAVSHPDAVTSHYAGRAYPVAYDTASMDETRTLSFALETSADAYAFRALAAAGGFCIYKSLDGEIMRAKADVTFMPAQTSAGRYGEVAITLTRLDGDVR